MPSVEPYMVTLDLINTVVFGGGVLFLGHGVSRCVLRYFVNAVIITICLNIWA